MNDDRPFDSGPLIDLTHPLAPGMPVWPGDPSTGCDPAATLSQHGYALHRWTVGEHSGTHMGAPGHRVEGGLRVDDYPVEDVPRPLVLLDAGGGKAVGRDDLLHAEASGSRIPPGAWIGIRCGWDRRWPDPARVFERDADGGFRWPGFDPEAVRWLAMERQAFGLCTDTPDLGAGSDLDLAAGLVAAQHGLWHLENLRGLGDVPAWGARLIVAPLLLAGGFGAPARVLALLPNRQ